jgi:hypothetical protein
VPGSNFRHWSLPRFLQTDGESECGESEGDDRGCKGISTRDMDVREFILRGGRGGGGAQEAF